MGDTQDDGRAIRAGMRRMGGLLARQERNRPPQNGDYGYGPVPHRLHTTRGIGGGLFHDDPAHQALQRRARRRQRVDLFVGIFPWIVILAFLGAVLWQYRIYLPQ